MEMEQLNDEDKLEDLRRRAIAEALVAVFPDNPVRRALAMRDEDGEQRSEFATAELDLDVAG